MDAKEIERQFSYRRLLSYNTKLKSDLINAHQDYKQ